MCENDFLRIKRTVQQVQFPVLDEQDSCTRNVLYRKNSTEHALYRKMKHTVIKKLTYQSTTAVFLLVS